MPLIYRLIICIAVATPLSALYYGYEHSGGLAYTFHTTTAVFFVLTSMICVLLAGSAPDTSGEQTTGKQTTKGKTKEKAKAKGKGRELGTVKWFNGGKGFGFITRSNGEEIFVHFRSLQKGSRRLAPGQTVEFAVSQGEKGPEASDVVVV